MSCLCTQRIAIAASERDLRAVLAKMADNFTAYNKSDCLEGASESDLSASELEEKFSAAANETRYIPVAFFGEDPDQYGEEGSSFNLQVEGDIWTLLVTLNLTRGASELPRAFCTVLDPKKYGWAIGQELEDEDFEVVYQTSEGEVVFFEGELQEGDPESLSELVKIAYDQVAGDDFDDGDWDDFDEF